MQMILCSEFVEGNVQEHLSHYYSKILIYYRDVTSKVKYPVPRTTILMGSSQLELFYDILLYSTEFLQTTGGESRYS